MRDYIGGTDLTITVPFGSPKDPVIPDVGSAKYTLRDHTGLALLTAVALTTTNLSYKTAIAIDASQLAIDAARDFERRTLWVDFEVAGVAFQKVESFRLIRLPEYSVQPLDVRGFIGVNDYELGDADIDVFAAYLYVRDDLGATETTTALTSGTRAELAANTMIKMRAVLDVLPGLKSRVAQSEKNGIKGFDRPVIKDFSALADAATAAYDAAKADTLGDAAGVDPVFVLITQDTDVITGA